MVTTRSQAQLRNNTKPEIEDTLVEPTHQVLRQTYFCDYIILIRLIISIVTVFLILIIDNVYVGENYINKSKVHNLVIYTLKK